MDLLKATESSLIGSLVESDETVLADSVCDRIDWLVNNHLQKVGTSKCGWNVFFRDPIDGRYWLLSYPQGHMHGGGPPVLNVVASEEVENIVLV